MAKIKGRLKNDVQTGRLLIIDLDNLPEITAEEFLSYIHEGFVPCIKSSADNVVLFGIGNFSVSSEGIIAVSGGPSPILFYPEGLDSSATALPEAPSDSSAS